MSCVDTSPMYDEEQQSWTPGYLGSPYFQPVSPITAHNLNLCISLDKSPFRQLTSSLCSFCSVPVIIITKISQTHLSVIPSLFHALALSSISGPHSERIEKVKK